MSVPLPPPPRSGIFLLRPSPQHSGNSNLALYFSLNIFVFEHPPPPPTEISNPLLGREDIDIFLNYK